MHRNIPKFHEAHLGPKFVNSNIKILSYRMCNILCLISVYLLNHSPHSTCYRHLSTFGSAMTDIYPVFVSACPFQLLKTSLYYAIVQNNYLKNRYYFVVCVNNLAVFDFITLIAKYLANYY